MNVKKDIVKPVLLTLSALILLFGLVILSLHLWCPYAMGQLSYKLGANDAALNYFEKDYKKAGNYNVLYTIVNLCIKQDDNQKLITYFEDFSSNENYKAFIKKVDEKNANLNVSNLVKSKLYSEDNYLKNRYVLALAKQNKKQAAFDYAFNNSSFEVLNNDLLPYLFTYISNQENFVNCDNSNVVAQKMCDYFNDLFTTFKTNYVSGDNIVLNLAIGGRINEVGNNIKDLRKLGYSVTLTDEQVNEVILQVNQKMAI